MQRLLGADSGVQVPALKRQQGPGTTSLRSFTMADIKKGNRERELCDPSKKPPCFIPAGCMIFTKKKNIQPQPCRKEKYLMI
jgi:hypothetical protein